MISNYIILLCDLAGEGWTISGTYPKQLPGKQLAKQRLYGYGLMRALHRQTRASSPIRGAAFRVPSVPELDIMESNLLHIKPRFRPKEANHDIRNELFVSA